MNKAVVFMCLMAFWCILSVGCSENDTEIHQRQRGNVVSIHDDVTVMPIDEDDVLVSNSSRLFLLGDYLLIADFNPLDKLVHVFDRQTYKYLASIGDHGPGPQEITIMGHIGTDEARRSFYVLDHGKLKMYAFEMDSVLAHPDYKPVVKKDLNPKSFPDRYLYVSDTLSYALMIRPTSASTYRQTVARWNMATDEMLPMPYTNPKATVNKMTFAASPSDSLYVECYFYHDLMTICHLDGSLKCNVYGPRWSDAESQETAYYSNVVFCKDKIVASYSGKEYYSDDYLPTQLLVFDLDGNYLKTLDVGYRIRYLCYDEKYDRLLMVLDDVVQFAYVSMEKVI